MREETREDLRRVMWIIIFIVVVILAFIIKAKFAHRPFDTTGWRYWGETDNQHWPRCHIYVRLDKKYLKVGDGSMERVYVDIFTGEKTYQP